MHAMDVILEFAQIGRAVEVRAIDARDGLEVAFMAPVGTPNQELELIALRKLDWVRKNKLAPRQAQSKRSKTNQPHRDRRGGIVV